MATQMAYALVQVTANDQTPSQPTLLAGSQGIVRVEHESATGTYRIDFVPELFNDAPAVIVTQAYNNISSTGDLQPINDCQGFGGGLTTDNAVVICSESGFCRIKTGIPGGEGRFRSFSILAISDNGA